jgi:hypothetical protein
MFTPHLGSMRGAVDIVKAEQAGIYDVKVIRGDSAEAITGWLKDNGFGFKDDDAQAFQEYVAQGWCFVTAKVDPNRPAGSKEVAAEGMAAPLILKFASERPVYPLALTTTVGTATEILIYAFGPNKLMCGDRLRLRHAGEARPQDVLNSLATEAEIKGWTLFDNLPETPMMLCKFKDRLTADQMKEDLVFEAAADNEPYRERKTVW